MAIEINKTKDKIILRYAPDNQDTSFIEDRFKKNGFILIKKIFKFLPKDVLRRDDSEYVFCLGKFDSSDNFFHINPRNLRLKYKLQIHKDVIINNSTFYCMCRSRYISLFYEMGKITKRDLIIGGNDTNNIPSDVFYEIVKCAPNDYEVDRYIETKFATILSTVFDDGIDDFPGKYETYTQKRLDQLKKVLKKDESSFGGRELNNYEVIKYKGVKDKIEQWLNDGERAHTEADWQHLIKNIIRLLFPKYIAVFEEAPVEDPYKRNSKGKNTTRKMDYLLVDADGNCDIAEIKSPFDHCILSTILYRDNYVPLRELSGAIMQVEKYIFYMNKKGISADINLNKKYKKELPPNFEIKVTNPKGLVILGRSKDFDKKQKRDFEIIKRKYQHVMDILSYDDILNRLNNMIIMLQK